LQWFEQETQHEHKTLTNREYTIK